MKDTRETRRLLVIAIGAAIGAVASQKIQPILKGMFRAR